ncbi:MAG: septum formation family protein [Acidimicrobiia bacterium]|nr:septum formation family protein [Acidimicrobiia bacterium]
MTDRRKPSPSDELLGQARGEAAADDAPGAFAPTSPTEDYEPVAPATFESATIEPLEHSLDFGDSEEMTAEEIAAILSESREERAPEPEPVVAETRPPAPEPRPAAETTSLPDWAKDDSPAVGVGAPPPPSSQTTAAPTAPAPPPPASVAVPSAGADSGPDDEVWSGEDRWTTPTTEWEAYEARRAEKRQARVDLPIPKVRPRLLVSLAAFVFVFGGMIWNLIDGREPIQDVAVGDCFIAGEAEEIQQVPIVDCTRKHDSELFAKVDMVGMGSAYPGDEVMFEWLFERCLEEFPAYVGEPYESSEYWIDMFIPLEDGWSDGDTTGLCTLVLVDDDLNIRTVSGSGRNAANNA